MRPPGVGKGMTVGVTGEIEAQEDAQSGAYPFNLHHAFQTLSPLAPGKSHTLGGLRLPCTTGLCPRC